MQPMYTESIIFMITIINLSVLSFTQTEKHNLSGVYDSALNHITNAAKLSPSIKYSLI